MPFLHAYVHIACSRLQDSSAVPLCSKKKIQNHVVAGEREGADPFTGSRASYFHLPCYIFTTSLLSESLVEANVCIIYEKTKRQIPLRTSLRKLMRSIVGMGLSTCGYLISLILCPPLPMMDPAS